MSMRRWLPVLATVATTTALSLSILAGWQRGGTLPERVVWVSIGVVLVVSAHLLPALIRDAPPVVRGIGSVLWGACLATACYGHAVFFMLAQQHAGERRATTVAVVDVVPLDRSLTVVMAERANVTRQLAFAQAQHCPRDCSGLEARRATLGAKLDALNAEGDDVRRRQTADDRVAAQRDALLGDPVTSRLAALLGMTVTRVDLLSGLLFAAVLEGVACLLWTVALRPPLSPAAVAAVTNTMASAVAPVAPVTDATAPAVTGVTPSRADETASGETVADSHVAATSRRGPGEAPVTPVPDKSASDSDVTQLIRDIAAGRVRPTVTDIRRHLGCSQARAVSLRRQLAERYVTA